jgi:hypothetical protein
MTYRDTIVLWTPEPPRGYGAFDQWEEDYCEDCHKPKNECICNIEEDGQGQETPSNAD